MIFGNKKGVDGHIRNATDILSLAYRDRQPQTKIGGDGRRNGKTTPVTSKHVSPLQTEQVNKMENLSLVLSLAEVEALLKTTGIAVQNLVNKLNKVGPHHPVGRSVNAEMQLLIPIQQQLLSIIANTSWVEA